MKELTTSLLLSLCWTCVVYLPRVLILISDLSCQFLVGTFVFNIAVFFHISNKFLLFVGNEREFQRLLTNGVNLNAMDENGNTALILAAERGDNFLLKYKNLFTFNIIPVHYSGDFVRNTKPKFSIF